MVSHSGVASLAAAQREQLKVTAESRILQFSSPSFDAAFWELVMVFGSGATLVIPGRDGLSGEGLGRVLGEGRVSHVTLLGVGVGVGAGWCGGAAAGSCGGGVGG
ncbi:hypothetical protein NEH83_33375 [Streptomyces sp. JUS-F4]|uniref:hypothetical protein n=1 Tax=Streptomyces sp. JUS-F4 TaxID=2951988 RepID=UPI002666BFF4|nr:hypothetical protein [Streptomyces sp. JUS-F4]WKN18653.1 hypothetical protein NEH83_33375 [Streptomyces sp. JUS-F4]